MSMRFGSCAIAIALAGQVLASASSWAAPAILTGHAKTLDGDTILIGGVKVRLKGIAAPEAGTIGGQASTEAMRALIDGREVRCELTGETTYQRAVGYCAAGTTDLNREMVRRGWALACPLWDVRGYNRHEPEARARNGLVWRIGYVLPGYCERKKDRRRRNL